jgi:hypothetical protein
VPDIAVGNDGDGVPITLVFANEHSAGLEAPGAIRSRLVAPDETVEMLRGVRIKLADGLLLDVPAKEPRDEILGKSQRRGRPKRRAPQGAKLVEAERPAPRINDMLHRVTFAAVWESPQESGSRAGGIMARFSIASRISEIRPLPKLKPYEPNQLPTAKFFLGSNA